MCRWALQKVTSPAFDMSALRSRHDARDEMFSTVTRYFDLGGGPALRNRGGDLLLRLGPEPGRMACSTTTRSPFKLFPFFSYTASSASRKSSNSTKP